MMEMKNHPKKIISPYEIHYNNTRESQLQVIIIEALPKIQMEMFIIEI